MLAEAAKLSGTDHNPSVNAKQVNAAQRDAGRFRPKSCGLAKFSVVTAILTGRTRDSLQVTDVITESICWGGD